MPGLRVAKPARAQSDELSRGEARRLAHPVREFVRTVGRGERGALSVTSAVQFSSRAPAGLTWKRTWNEIARRGGRRGKSCRMGMCQKPCETL